MKVEENELSLLELFSGIGGMHYAFEYANISCRAFPVDTNPLANQVYSHNFPSCKIEPLNISTLKSNHHIFKNSFDVWSLSPPCQPYTRQSINARGINDPRSDSLLNIIKLLSELTNDLLPKVIIIENVENFHCFTIFEKLAKILKFRRFQYRKFIISPLELGFPNQRYRFYLVAKLSPLTFSKELNILNPDDIIKFSQLINSFNYYYHEENLPPFESQQRKREETSNIFLIPSIQTFLETDSNLFDLNSTLLEKPTSVCLDIVKKEHDCHPCFYFDQNLYSVILSKGDSVKVDNLIYGRSSKNFNTSIFKTNFKNISISDSLTNTTHSSTSRPYTLCFTRNYGRYMKGTGSVLLKSSSKFKSSFYDEHNIKNSELQSQDRELNIFHNFSITNKFVFLDMNSLSGKLRYFTPSEIARLMGFKMRKSESIKYSIGNFLWDLNHFYHICLPLPLEKISTICLDNIENSYSERSRPRNENIIKNCNCFNHPFEFPQSINIQSQWRLIGNSLNPQVVAYILIACGIRNIKNELK